MGVQSWVDIIRDGVVLFELPGHPLVAPKPLTPSDAFSQAKDYFDAWMPAIDRALRTVDLRLAERGQDARRRKDAAFMLRQAAERSSGCLRLVRTFHYPRTHSLKFLRSLAEGAERAVVEAWPDGTRQDRRRFEWLKRAYVEARYSDAYEMSAEDMHALIATVRRLRDLKSTWLLAFEDPAP